VYGHILFTFGGLFLGLSFFLVSAGGYYVNWALFSLGSCEVGITVVFDWMSMLFLSFVLLISSGVMFYRDGYMSDD
jgi:NADH-ubiquinone oxidoreductase chain 5